MATKSNSHLFTPRHRTSYGIHALTFSSLVGYRPIYPYGPGSWGDSLYPHTRNYSIRETPVPGIRTADGFRLPTRWSMVAYNAVYQPFSYSCSNYGIPWTLYDVRGDGPDTLHGRGTIPKLSVLSNRATVDIHFNTSNRSRMQAIGKIKKQNINVGAAIGESKQTVKMLASLVSRLAKALLHVMKGRFKLAYQTLGLGTGKGLKKDLANFWLEFQYGIKPLVNDIYGLQEQIKQGFAKPQRFSVSSEVKEALSPSLFWTVSPKSIEGDAFELSRTVFWQKVSAPWLLNLNQLGVINPAAIAWELTRLSFVIDWLLPIGNFLSAFTDTVGCEFIAGYEDRIVFANLKVMHHYQASLDAGVPMRAELRTYSFERRVLLGWGIPIPYVKSPFRSTNVISALALLTQLRK